MNPSKSLRQHVLDLRDRVGLGHTAPRSVLTDFSRPIPPVPPQAARSIRSPLARPGTQAHDGFGLPTPHEMPATTHTVVLSQLNEINDCLADERPAHRVTAGELGLALVATADDRGADRLPDESVLVKVCADGPPEYPYIHAHFAAAGSAGRTGPAVALHTEALRTLSRALGLRHRWGL